MSWNASEEEHEDEDSEAEILDRFVAARMGKGREGPMGDNLEDDIYEEDRDSDDDEDNTLNRLVSATTGPARDRSRTRKGYKVSEIDLQGDNDGDADDD